MSILFILIIISLTLASGFLIAFFWAVRSGQFEDDYTPSIRILFDDENGNDETLPEKEDKVIPANGDQIKEKTSFNEK
jgi:cbb3-type cytochrome oxidase maturation protein